jgi:hypothetical protein
MCVEPLATSPQGVAVRARRCASEGRILSLHTSGGGKTPCRQSIELPCTSPGPLAPVRASPADSVTSEPARHAAIHRQPGERTSPPGTGLREPRAPSETAPRTQRLPSDPRWIRPLAASRIPAGSHRRVGRLDASRSRPGVAPARPDSGSRPRTSLAAGAEGSSCRVRCSANTLRRRICPFRRLARATSCFEILPAAPRADRAAARRARRNGSSMGQEPTSGPFRLRCLASPRPARARHGQLRNTTYGVWGARVRFTTHRSTLHVPAPGHATNRRRKQCARRGQPRVPLDARRSAQTSSQHAADLRRRSCEDQVGCDGAQAAPCSVRDVQPMKDGEAFDGDETPDFDASVLVARATAAGVNRSPRVLGADPR